MFVYGQSGRCGGAGPPRFNGVGNPVSSRTGRTTGSVLEPAILQSPNPNLMILVVPVQPLVGSGETLPEDLDIVPKSVQPHLHSDQSPFQAVEAVLEAVEAPIDPFEFPPQEIDELRVLVGSHEVSEGAAALHSDGR